MGGRNNCEALEICTKGAEDAITIDGRAGMT
jgi:hypothetical protein